MPIFPSYLSQNHGSVMVHAAFPANNWIASAHVASTRAARIEKAELAARAVKSDAHPAEPEEIQLYCRCNMPGWLKWKILVAAKEVFRDGTFERHKLFSSNPCRGRRATRQVNNFRVPSDIKRSPWTRMQSQPVASHRSGLFQQSFMLFCGFEKSELISRDTATQTNSLVSIFCS